MSAKIIDGQSIAAALRAEIAERVRASIGGRPHLAAVLVGDDPASQVYVRNKRRACDQVGMESSLITLPASANQSQLIDVVRRLNADRMVNGILVQFPLPAGMDEFEVTKTIDPYKDVDAFHPENVGLYCTGQPRFLPCTPAGVCELLQREGVGTAGKHVVVVGRSNLVGRPLSILLSQRGDRADATVTLCHSRTRGLAETCRTADILIAAIGRPHFVTEDFVKQGAIVIDVGINRLPDGRLVGDVAFDRVLDIAHSITPVPKGVGPMTIACLLQNTLQAAQLQDR